MTKIPNIILALTALTLAVLGGIAPVQCTGIKRELPVETKMRAIAENLRCPVCQGQSVYDSNSALARQMKQTITEKLNAGETPTQINVFFKERYGDYVLMAPPQSGLHWVIWLGPFVLVLIGAGLIAWRVSHTRQQILTGSGNGSHEDMERLEL